MGVRKHIYIADIEHTEKKTLQRRGRTQKAEKPSLFSRDFKASVESSFINLGLVRRKTRWLIGPGLLCDMS